MINFVTKNNRILKYVYIYIYIIFKNKIYYLLDIKLNFYKYKIVLTNYITI